VRQQNFADTALNVLALACVAHAPPFLSRNGPATSSRRFHGQRGDVKNPENCLQHSCSHPAYSVKGRKSFADTACHKPLCQLIAGSSCPEYSIPGESCAKSVLNSDVVGHNEFRFGERYRALRALDSVAFINN